MIVDCTRLLDFATNHPEYSEQDIEQDRARIQFYFHTLYWNEHNQRYGKKSIVLAEGITMGKMWRKMNEMFPMKKDKFYIVQYSQRLKNALRNYFFRFFVQVGRTFLGVNPESTTASSKDEMLHKLLQAVFPLHLIPKMLEGPWSHKRQLGPWIQELTQRDDERNQRVLLGGSETQ